MVILFLVLWVATQGPFGKESFMGAGWEDYGRAAGYSQAQWDALSQAQRDRIKGGGSYGSLSGSVGGTLGTAGQTIGSLPVTEYGAEATYADPGGYTDSGGAYGGGGVVNRGSLNEAPEWLAYLNALNFAASQFRSDIDKQKALYTSESERQLTDLPAGYQSQRRGISGSMESRGMSRSGEFLRRLAENRAQQGRAEGAIKGQLAFQTGSLESQLAQKLLDINARKAQQELQMRGQGYS